MMSDHQKMKGMIAAVIEGANQAMEMDWHNGAWDIQRALQLYGIVKHLFVYPSKSTRCRRNDQISWRTVYNIYMKNGKTFATGAGMVIGAVVEDIETDFNIETDFMME
jgi:hypothetical protein